MKHLGKTPPFRGQTGEILPGSIAEIAYLRLGGLDQWVMIRGESVVNPVLILLHGGPGFPEMRFFRFFNAALEKSFTVVYWDQRGTDKSFQRKIPPSSMTIERFIADLDELVDAMRKRFGKDRVAIYGHSWGSALGILYAVHSPEKVAVYVGAGQVGDWLASEVICYNFTLAEAERRGNRKALRELRAIGPPPYTARRVMVQRKWLTRFVGMVRGMSMWRVSRIIISGPESSIFDLPNILCGTLFSTYTMWDEVSQLNLVKAAHVLQMPALFFIGRHDHVIAPEISVAYFDMLTAPSKRLIWFEESAHEPPFEEPAKFNAAIMELARPAAVG
ncbi:MAG TPA: alpha/beta hydrolase [Bryobacteraceae bacterium]|jgi:pimeloyl-ACP methyl ester carboxylesterase